MKRTEAVEVIAELLQSCPALDGHPITLTAPNPTITTSGYQIIIYLSLDETTKKNIQDTATKHGLTCQIGNLFRTKRSINKDEPDTCIIYKPQKSLT
ncbi:MAG TPA: hypothetical protein VLH35_07535 [Candidatus Acidoferrales bacterium]|nr:hypothetical protein [Candidatus Acidoferrales bacterium]